MLTTSVLSGTLDVDVAVLSTLRLVGQSITSEMAGTFVLAALGANAVGRLAMAILAGPIRFWAPLAAATIAAIGLGFAVLPVCHPCEFRTSFLRCLTPVKAAVVASAYVRQRKEIPP